MPSLSSLELPAALARLAAQDGERWTLLTGHHDLGVCRARLERLSRSACLPSALTMVPPPDRRPVITGHGMDAPQAAAQIAAARSRYWVIAPFRSAIALGNLGVRPDVIVLAERDTEPVDDSLTRWSGLSALDAETLRAATLVADAFAPPELVGEFSQTFRFDTGLGCAAPLPFEGSGILAAASLAAALGHRRVSIVGVTRSGVLAEHLATLTEAGLECCELSSDSPACCEAVPHRQDAGALLPVDAARARGARELFALQRKRDRLAVARTPDAGKLLDEIRDQWARDRSVRAAVRRLETSWVRSMWDFGRSRQPLRAKLSTHALFGLVVPELHAAIDAHLRDCRSCLLETIGASPQEAVLQ